MHTHWLAGIRIQAAAAAAKSLAPRSANSNGNAAANRTRREKKMEGDVQLGSQQSWLLLTTSSLIYKRPTSILPVYVCVETEHIIVTYLNLWKWIITWIETCHGEALPLFHSFTTIRTAHAIRRRVVVNRDFCSSHLSSRELLFPFFVFVSLRFGECVLGFLLLFIITIRAALVAWKLVFTFCRVYAHVWVCVSLFK